MTKSKLPRAELELMLERLVAVNRGFPVPAVVLLELRYCLEGFPSIEHVAKTLSVWIAANKKLPTPADLMEIHRDLLAAGPPVRARRGCSDCGDSGWLHITKNGWSCVERCKCMGKPAVASPPQSGFDRAQGGVV